MAIVTEGRASAGIGGCLVFLVENRRIVIPIGGDIKPDTFYEMKNGIAVECKQETP